MKKILLIIALTLLIFQMVIMAIDIDIGSPAIDREHSITSMTVVTKVNPANDSGVINNVEIWAAVNLENCKVATFYVVSGNNLSTRDTHTIGSVTAGSKQTFEVEIDVQAGDYIGIYFSAGELDRLNEPTVGLWYGGAGVDLIPCSNQAFNFTAYNTLSLYGTGTTEVGWPHKWNTVTIGKLNTKEFTKWNDLE